MVPISSLAQYTTAPTIRGGYIINAEGMGMLQRPSNSSTPSSSLAGGSPAHPPTHTVPLPSPLAMNPLGHVPIPMTVGGSSTLRRTKVPMLQTQLSYDGTAPRTLSTGVAVGSQFYYGWQNTLDYEPHVYTAAVGIAMGRNVDSPSAGTILVQAADQASSEEGCGGP